MARQPWSTLALAGLLIAAEADPGRAQVGNVPVLLGIYPPGASVGQATEWTISGRNISRASALRISGGGVEVIGLTIREEGPATATVRVASDAVPGFREVRIDGPSGLSNLAIVRVDPLRQVLEVEPNDEPKQAQTAGVGSALVGVLRALDVDHYRIEGPPGQRVTLDLEARRVGTSLAPVLTVFDASGNAIAQGRESRGGDRDCRMTLVIPPEGTCLLQVRDNVYGGGDQARYRLRVDPAPFATSVFPPGGPRGQAIEVELGGGNLLETRRKSITLPDVPGSMINPGLFDGPLGPIGGPARLVVGDGPELVEPVGDGPRSPIALSSGRTVNGRIGRPGEVDSFTIRVKAGEKLRVRVEAESFGSWLDSVLVLRDQKGATLAENDDSRVSTSPDQSRPMGLAGVPELSPDSTLDHEAKVDGTLTIDLADRFGDGGPEYGYRLSVGPARPDFSVTLLIGINAQGMGAANQGRVARTTPGQSGAFNLRPGASAGINFLVTPEGRPGSVVVRAEGLPEGVTAEPVDVRLGGPPVSGSTATLPVDAPATSDVLVLKVAPHVQPGLHEFRVVARSKGPGPAIVREASASFGIDPAAVPGRSLARATTRFPLRIIGEARPLFVGPPSPPTLRSVGVPGPLLQGDRLDLALDFSVAVTADDGSTIEARAEGIGLSTSTVISAGTSPSDEGPTSDVTVHVLASTRAQLGPHVVKVAYTPAGGVTLVREVTVEVVCPVEVRPAVEAVFLGPGEVASFAVEVRRAKGFEGEVELRLEGLPRGIKGGKAIVLAPGTARAEVRLEMASDANPLAKAAELRVVGIARMPRGNVPVDSKLRPMIRPRVADK